jgi:hypothetical protein
MEGAYRTIACQNGRFSARAVSLATPAPFSLSLRQALAWPRHSGLRQALGRPCAPSLREQAIPLGAARASHFVVVPELNAPLATTNKFKGLRGVPKSFFLKEKLEVVS